MLVEFSLFLPVCFWRNNRIGIFTGNTVKQRIRVISFISQYRLRLNLFQ